MIKVNKNVLFEGKSVLNWRYKRVKNGKNETYLQDLKGEYLKTISHVNLYLLLGNQKLAENRCQTLAAVGADRKMQTSI